MQNSLSVQKIIMVIGTQSISGRTHINLVIVGALEKGTGWLGDGMEL